MNFLFTVVYFVLVICNYLLKCILWKATTTFHLVISDAGSYLRLTDCCAGVCSKHTFSERERERRAYKQERRSFLPSFLFSYERYTVQYVPKREKRKEAFFYAVWFTIKFPLLNHTAFVLQVS